MRPLECCTQTQSFDAWEEMICFSPSGGETESAVDAGRRAQFQHAAQLGQYGTQSYLSLQGSLKFTQDLFWPTAAPAYLLRHSDHLPIGRPKDNTNSGEIKDAP
jgi:hypothetical protein